MNKLFVHHESPGVTAIQGRLELPHRAPIDNGHTPFSKCSVKESKFYLHGSTSNVHAVPVNTRQYYCTGKMTQVSRDSCRGQGAQERGHKMTGASEPSAWRPKNKTGRGRRLRRGGHLQDTLNHPSLNSGNDMLVRGGGEGGKEGGKGG